jgi:hypothetical protein
LNKQQVKDWTLAYQTEARTSVEDARQDLIRTLSAIGDADGAAKSAVSRASALSKQQASRIPEQLSQLAGRARPGWTAGPF